MANIKIEYKYYRTKEVVFEKGVKKIYLDVCIYTNTLENSVLKEVNTIKEYEYLFNYDEAPQNIRNLNDDTEYITLTELEFELLIESFTNHLESFIFYKSVVGGGKKDKY